MNEESKFDIHRMLNEDILKNLSGCLYESISIPFSLPGMIEQIIVNVTLCHQLVRRVWPFEETAHETNMKGSDD